MTNILKQSIVIILLITGGAAPVPFNFISALLGGVLFEHWFEERT